MKISTKKLKIKVCSLIVAVMLIFSAVFSVNAFEGETGDINGDAVVDVKDLLILCKILCEMEIVNDDIMARCDTNHDGRVNVIDATTLQVANHNLWHLA